MALNMSDPAAVMKVYSSILDNERNWLLLHYVNDAYDELGLHSYGSEGIEELKTKISDLDKVFIAFYREEVDADPGYILINYIPASISGVKRARALVHSRRVGAILKKHQTIFTVDSLSLITSDNIHQAITNPDTAFSPVTPSPATPSPIDKEPLQDRQGVSSSIPSSPAVDPDNGLQPLRAKPKAIPKDMVRRSFTAIHAPGVKPPSPSPAPKGGSSLFSSLLRRKKKYGASTDDLGAGLPPPTPPKDKGKIQSLSMGYSFSQPSQSTITEERTVRHQRSHSFSDFEIVSRAFDSEDLVVIEPTKDPLPPRKDIPVQHHTIPLKGKWSQGGSPSSDPAARAQRRRELQLQREREEREALEEEAKRQQQIKREKEALLQQEMEDEKQRKAETEEEIRRITAERRLRAQTEREEDERKRQELEERKRLDKDRRLEEHRRLEQWRSEQAQKEQEATLRAQKAKLVDETERTKKIQQAEAKAKQTKGESDLTGWITVLGQDSLSWKRRFYKFVGSTVFLYRDSKDLTAALEQVELRGEIRALREWNEGYEDLEAIAFSFVVEFKDGRQYWSMYADSDAEKYKILGLFKVAGGL